MPRQRLDCYVRSARLASGLTQRELATLLGCGEDVVQKREAEWQPTTIEFALGCSIVFGKSIADLFPALVERVQQHIGRNAINIDELFRDRTDAVSLKKLAMLEDITKRTIEFTDL
ncbi:MAG: hypothetical protein ACTHPD_17560 [Rhizomicrobium sp.]